MSRITLLMLQLALSLSSRGRQDGRYEVALLEEGGRADIQFRSDALEPVSKAAEEKVKHIAKDLKSEHRVIEASSPAHGAHKQQ